MKRDTLIFGLILYISLCVSEAMADTIQKDISETKHYRNSLSVKRGSPARKAILNAVRKQIKAMHHLDVIFVVRHLKAKNGWAWAHLLPQSHDGKSHYEDISALLHQKDGVWHVVEIPCAEEEDPACITHPRYFSNLHKRFPDIPIEILPQEE